MRRILFYIPTSFTISLMFALLFLHFKYGRQINSQLFIYLFYASITFFPFLIRKFRLNESNSQVKFSIANNLIFGGLFVLVLLSLILSVFSTSVSIIDWSETKLWYYLSAIMIVGMSAEFIGRWKFENSSNLKSNDESDHQDYA
jgi:NADH:ubiquinone oxidoreductase subunit 2 (subunit N)